MADEELEEDLEDEEVDDLDEDEEGLEEDEGSRSKGRKRLLIVIAAVLVLILGGAAAAYFTGLMQPLIEMLGGGKEVAIDEGGPQQIVSSDAVFYDLPEMLVNINTSGRKPVYLKIRVSLELENGEGIARVESMMPRIVDNFQVYLRELRIEDLKGSAGMYRLREELLKRVNVAVAPTQVNDVLFKEMLVQ